MISLTSSEGHISICQSKRAACGMAKAYGRFQRPPSRVRCDEVRWCSWNTHSQIQLRCTSVTGVTSMPTACSLWSTPSSTASPLTGFGARAESSTNSGLSTSPEVAGCISWEELQVCLVKLVTSCFFKVCFATLTLYFSFCSPGVFTSWLTQRRTSS